MQFTNSFAEILGEKILYANFNDHCFKYYSDVSNNDLGRSRNALQHAQRSWQQNVFFTWARFSNAVTQLYVQPTQTVMSLHLAVSIYSIKKKRSGLTLVCKLIILSILSMSTNCTQNLALMSASHFLHTMLWLDVITPHRSLEKEKSSLWRYWKRTRFFKQRWWTSHFQMM